MENVNVNNLLEAQADMRNNYGYGSIGVIVSGAVWILASSIISLYSAQQGIWTLVIGGMFIFPLATLLGKLIGIEGRHHKNNPIAKLAMEGTIWMMMCIPLAYGLSLAKTEWFFQGMLMIIAGRYLTFASIYGMRLYWFLGAALALAAYLLFKLEASTFDCALTGGLIESIFGIVIYVLYRYNKRREHSSLA